MVSARPRRYGSGIPVPARPEVAPVTIDQPPFPAAPGRFPAAPGPFPAGWGHPPGPPGYGPSSPPGYGPPAYPAPVSAPPGYAPAPASPVRTSGLVVAAFVLATTALLGMLGMVVWLVGSGGDLGGGDDGSTSPLRGTVPVAVSGAVSGPALAEEVRRRIREDGGDPTQLSCPDTARVAQGITTVCHGVIDSEDWNLAVFFESAAGAYSLLPF